MNYLKVLVAFFLFSLTFLLTKDWVQVANTEMNLLFISGFIGLGIGDVFLLTAFVRLGPARTLVLFSFQPIIFLFVDNFLFGLEIHATNLVAIAIFILCLLLFAIENKNPEKKWELAPLLIALTGILLDGVGLFLTKKSFAALPDLSGLQANIIRSIGAISFYFILQFFKPINLFSKFKSLENPKKAFAIFICITGTYASLLCYLNALKLGALSMVTAISVTSPIFSTIFESIFDKKKPTKTLYICLILFIIAFSLNFSQLSMR